MRFSSRSAWKLLAALVASCLMLSGCVFHGSHSYVGKKDYAYYSVVSLPDAEFMPSEAELRHEAAKVLVIDGDDGGTALARSLHLALQVSKATITVLSAAGIEVVDNSMASKVPDVFKIAESRGINEYAGPQLANYVVRPNVRLADYRVDVDQEKYGRNGSQNYFLHKVDVKISIQVYEIPSLKMLTTINAEGSGKLSNTQRNADQALAASLMNSAVDQAMKTCVPAFSDVFAKKGKGYVSAKKVNQEQNAIFLITIGSDDGLKPGDKVSVYSRRTVEFDNLLKNSPSYEDVLVADGIVTDVMTDSQAWIVVLDSNDIPRIMRGDIVKIEKKYQL